MAGNRISVLGDFQCRIRVIEGGIGTRLSGEKRDVAGLFYEMGRKSFECTLRILHQGGQAEFVVTLESRSVV